MLHPKLKSALLAPTIVLYFSVLSAHAWSFLTSTLNSPYDQCLTCHVSNSNLALNAYGQDYLDPAFAATYHSKHNSSPGNCNTCHSGKGYPITTIQRTNWRAPARLAARAPGRKSGFASNGCTTAFELSTASTIGRILSSS